VGPKGCLGALEKRKAPAPALGMLDQSFLHLINFSCMFLLVCFFQALVEQFSYSPFAMASFFFGMSLLQGKSFSESAHEVRTKFWPTLQVSLVILFQQ